MKIYQRVFFVLFILFKATLCLAVQKPGIIINGAVYNPYIQQFILVGKDEADEAFVGTLDLRGGNRIFVRHHLAEGRSPLMFVKVITAGPFMGYVELFSKDGTLFITDPSDMQAQTPGVWKVTGTHRDYLGSRILLDFTTDEAKSPVAHNNQADYFIVRDQAGMTHVVMRYLGAGSKFYVSDIFTAENINSVEVTRDNTELIVQTSTGKIFKSIATKDKAQAPSYRPALLLQPPSVSTCPTSNPSFTTRYRSGTRITRECLDLSGRLDVYQNDPNGRVGGPPILTQTVNNPSKTAFGVFGDIPMVTEEDSDFGDVELATFRGDDDLLNISTTTLNSDGTPATPKQTQKISTTLFPICTAGGEVELGRFIKIVAGVGNEILISETNNPEAPAVWIKHQI